MAGQWFVFAIAMVFLVVGTGMIWRPISSAWRQTRFAEACRRFHQQRERLEAKFEQLGSIHAKSGAPGWTDCDFDDDVVYARNRSTGDLSAFVAVTIEMEDRGTHSSGTSDVVGNLRAASAVFRFDHDHWETDGRVIFNLSPTEAIHFCKQELEVVAHEAARHS